MSNTLTISAEGFVGDDPKYFVGEKDNKNYVNFRMAHTDRYKDKTGVWSNGSTTWLSVKAWGTLAENVANSVYKADPVYVEGHFTMDEYTDKDNVVHTVPTILANKILFNMTKGICTINRNKTSENSDITADSVLVDSISQNKGKNNPVKQKAKLGK
ncbi:MAG: single-stranded DNA-binding protein [Bifidobacteriaceae bacterium]|jgi:single-strand DNA-binding protein|nr:single-stranded DNA-binding protein [Bifidobacteriaceae bacterium]